MSDFTGRELREVTGGEWLKQPPDSFTVQGISTDTRRRGDHECFLALSGERFDAHDFLADAIAANYGALCIGNAQTNKLPPDCPVPVLVVEDTLAAYQALARMHRRRFPELTVAAVTGSVGKTSVKEMLRAIFCCETGEEHVLYTAGNTNNQVGVPQNLLRLTAAHKYAVIEMGTNHHGEIEPLSRCAEPQVGIVNSIAPCHLEFLGSLEGVAEEKSRIFAGLRPGGTAVIPVCAPGQAVLEKAAAPFRVLRFGEGYSSSYLGGNLEGSSFLLRFPDGEEIRVEWALTGRHQAVNAGAAAMAAYAAGVAPATIAQGLSRTRLPGMRSKITRFDGVTYFNDAYNANPESMAASFRLIAENAGDYAAITLVLGEMRELGENSRQAHADILRLARELLPTAEIFTVGEGFCASPGDSHFAVPEDTAGKLKPRSGGLVFAKGSRGIEVERVLPEEAR